MRRSIMEAGGKCDALRKYGLSSSRRKLQGPEPTWGRDVAVRSPRCEIRHTKMGVSAYTYPCCTGASRVQVVDGSTIATRMRHG